MQERYRLIRKYFNREDEILEEDLTLEQVKAHCRDPETSSSSCSSAEGYERTKKFGPWFDSYELE